MAGGGGDDWGAKILVLRTWKFRMSPFFLVVFLLRFFSWVEI